LGDFKEMKTYRKSLRFSAINFKPSTRKAIASADGEVGRIGKKKIWKVKNNYSRTVNQNQTTKEGGQSDRDSPLGQNENPRPFWDWKILSLIKGVGV